MHIIRSLSSQRPVAVSSLGYNIFKESSLTSDFTETGVVLAEGGGSGAGGGSAYREIPADRLYIIDCLSVCSLSISSQ